MHKKISSGIAKRPKYIAIHPELVKAHIAGVAGLTALASILFFVTRWQHVNAVLLALFVATFVETFLERMLLSNVRKEEREFVQWKKKLRENGQFQSCECKLIHDYESDGLAMIVGKLRTSKNKSLYFVSPKFRWRGDADLNVIADIWYTPSDRLVYIQKFRLSEKDC